MGCSRCGQRSFGDSRGFIRQFIRKLIVWVSGMPLDPFKREVFEPGAFGIYLTPKVEICVALISALKRANDKLAVRSEDR